MIKLLIADDEPLVQIGIKSMLNWADYNIEVCGTAVNGAQALELIEKHLPQIVISDIKMPVMNGLELAKACQERFGKFPLFIILTSYEEFQLAQEALRYRVLDYLVKLELDRDTLEASILKALEIIKQEEALAYSRELPSSLGVQAFQDKFFIRLLHNLFDSEEQFQLQMKELGLSFSSPCFSACHCEIKSPESMSLPPEKQLGLYTSTVQMVREIIVKYMDCYVVSLDMKHFALLILHPDSGCFKDSIREALESTFFMVHNYFNVTILTAVGHPCTSPSQIAESYQEARQIFSIAEQTGQSILFWDDTKEASPKNAFNMSLFKADLLKAFEEFDTETLSLVFGQLTDLFKQHPARYLQAIDAACNILYLAISLLPEGEETMSQIFSGYPDGYRSIYKQSTTEQVVDWMNFFCEQLCLVLEEKKRTYKNRIVSNVKKYINGHIEERLSLNETASIFGISPNYLSLLFKKYGEVGFSEYISQMKIAKAKELMTEGNLKIYEIADRLGFESAFYFSKVFKKVTGCAPRDYQQTRLP